MQILGLGSGLKPFIVGLDLASGPDKTAVSQRFIKPLHNHRRLKNGKKPVSLAERKRRKRRITRASKQRNRKYA